MHTGFKAYLNRNFNLKNFDKEKFLICCVAEENVQAGGFFPPFSPNQYSKKKSLIIRLQVAGV